MRVNVTTDDNFDWGVLGKDWWMESMETVRATLNQAKFACARHAGATRTKAAELAEYSASDNRDFALPVLAPMTPRPL